MFLLHTDSVGYTLTFDNVNHRTVARHQHADEDGNQDINLVQAYAAKERISSSHLSEEPPTPAEIREVNFRP